MDHPNPQLPAISGIVRDPGVADYYHQPLVPSGPIPLINQSRTISSSSSVPSTLSSSSVFSLTDSISQVMTPKTPPMMDTSPHQSSGKSSFANENGHHQHILPTRFDPSNPRTSGGAIVPDLALNSSAGGVGSGTHTEITIHNAQQPEQKKQKRPRRKFDEIERIYKCNYPNCTKAYGTLNHLNVHVSTMQHGPRRAPDEFKEERRQWKQRKKQQMDDYHRAALIQQQQQFRELWHMGHPAMSAPIQSPLQSGMPVQHILPSPPGRSVSGYNSMPINTGYMQPFALNPPANDLSRYYVAPSTPLSTNVSRPSNPSNLALSNTSLNQPGSHSFQQHSYSSVPQFPLVVQGYSGSSGPSSHTMPPTDTRDLAAPQLRPLYTTSIGSSWMGKQVSPENPHPVQPQHEQPLSHLHPQYFGGK